MRHNIAHMRKILLTILALCYCTTTCAEPAPITYQANSDLPWYQVEIIVFETVAPEQTNEKWPVVLEESAGPVSMELSEAASKQDENVVAFQTLRAEELQLTDHIKSLEHNNAKKVLLHTGWRQPLQENAPGVPVHVYSHSIEPDNNPDTLNPQPEVLNNLPDPESNPVVVEDNPVERPENFVDGTISLTLTRYLHLKTHMVYFNPDVDLARQIAEPDSNTPVVDRFLLKESRRVKRKEIHYLDHPYFGILVRVSRYEPEKQQN